MVDSGASNTGSLWKGVAWVLLPALVLTPICLAIGQLGPGLADRLGILVFVPGLIEWAWVLPAAIVFGRRGERRTLAGLLGAAGLVVLLNGACFGLFLTSMTQGHW